MHHPATHMTLWELGSKVKYRNVNELLRSMGCAMVMVSWMLSGCMNRKNTSVSQNIPSREYGPRIAFDRAEQMDRILVLDLVDQSECWFGLSEGKLDFGSYTPKRWILIKDNVETIADAVVKVLKEEPNLRTGLLVSYFGGGPAIAKSYKKPETFEICFKEITMSLDQSGVEARRAPSYFHFTLYP